MAKLTDRHEASLPYLVAAPGTAKGARLAWVGLRRLQRWINDDDLQRLTSEFGSTPTRGRQGQVLASYFTQDGKELAGNEAFEGAVDLRLG